ncbi:DUF4173 domain-containing protein [Lewinella sp. IMCC34183]|uniref:DUF4153 domain-containing protein n=1 Tax=Lewinella sp. IMCC34183 TaxID=2248762 RepID=UPI000E21C36C|nr:DUF4173 domain-containing protein [Lewinella sp. IMCC34183]
MIKSYHLFLLSVAFAYFFFPMELGANVFAFDALLIVFLLRQRPTLGRRALFVCTVAGLLASAVSVVIVHGRASILAHHISLLLLLGYAQRRELRFVGYAALLGLLSLACGPMRFLRRIGRSTQFLPVVRTSGRWIGPAAVAAGVSVPFLVLYGAGNAAWGETLQEVFGRYLPFIFHVTALEFVGMMVLGLALTVPFFLTGDEGGLLGYDAALSDELLRQRKKRLSLISPLALPRAYRRGLVTFGLLNCILFAVNLTDLRFGWWSPAGLSAAALSSYLHEGTYSLILSICLAMVMVLYYFRGNLNFYGPATPLRRMTYLWLGQNAFLAFSVALRNYHYVREYGLATGRVQVGFVLVLMLVGLYTLYRKVRYRRSLTYLLQVNGLAAWLFLIAYGAVNWSGVITRVNLQSAPERIDWQYLVHGLDDRNAFLLQASYDRIPAQFQRNVKTSRMKIPRYDWRSWNYADWRNR